MANPQNQTDPQMARNPYTIDIREIWALHNPGGQAAGRPGRGIHIPLDDAGNRLFPDDDRFNDCIHYTLPFLLRWMFFKDQCHDFLESADRNKWSEAPQSIPHSGGGGGGGGGGGKKGGKAKSIEEKRKEEDKEKEENIEIEEMVGDGSADLVVEALDSEYTGAAAAGASSSSTMFPDVNDKDQHVYYKHYKAVSGGSGICSGMSYIYPQNTPDQPQVTPENCDQIPPNSDYHYQVLNQIRNGSLAPPPAVQMRNPRAASAVPTTKRPANWPDNRKVGYVILKKSYDDDVAWLENNLYDQTKASSIGQIVQRYRSRYFTPPPMFNNVGDIGTTQMTSDVDREMFRLLGIEPKTSNDIGYTNRSVAKIGCTNSINALINYMIVSAQFSNETWAGSAPDVDFMNICVDADSAKFSYASLLLYLCDALSLGRNRTSLKQVNLIRTLATEYDSASGSAVESYINSLIEMGQDIEDDSVNMAQQGAKQVIFREYGIKTVRKNVLNDAVTDPPVRNSKQKPVTYIPTETTDGGREHDHPSNKEYPQFRIRLIFSRPGDARGPLDLLDFTYNRYAEDPYGNRMPMYLAGNNNTNPIGKYALKIDRFFCKHAKPYFIRDDTDPTQLATGLDGQRIRTTNQHDSGFAHFNGYDGPDKEGLGMNKEDASVSALTDTYRINGIVVNERGTYVPTDCFYLNSIPLITCYKTLADFGAILRYKAFVDNWKVQGGGVNAPGAPQIAGLTPYRQLNNSRWSDLDQIYRTQYHVSFFVTFDRLCARISSMFLPFTLFESGLAKDFRAPMTIFTRRESSQQWLDSVRAAGRRSLDQTTMDTTGANLLLDLSRISQSGMQPAQESAQQQIAFTDAYTTPVAAAQAIATAINAPGGVVNAVNFANAFGKSYTKIKTISVETLKRKLKSVGILITKVTKTGKRIPLTRKELEQKANAFTKLQLKAKNKNIKITYIGRDGTRKYKNYKRLLSDLEKINKFGAPRQSQRIRNRKQEAYDQSMNVERATAFRYNERLIQQRRQAEAESRQRERLERAREEARQQRRCRAMGSDENRGIRSYSYNPFTRDCRPNYYNSRPPFGGASAVPFGGASAVPFGVQADAAPPAVRRMNAAVTPASQQFGRGLMKTFKPMVKSVTRDFKEELRKRAQEDARKKALELRKRALIEAKTKMYNKNNVTIVRDKQNNRIITASRMG